MIAIRTFRYLYTRTLSFLTITCKMESQKHASRFDLRYDTYSGLWCHKPMKELGFECDFVKVAASPNHPATAPPDCGHVPVDESVLNGRRLWERSTSCWQKRASRRPLPQGWWT